MSEHEIARATQKSETYEIQPGDTLYSIAYEHVLPPHSPASVSRCLENIVDNNKWGPGNDFEDKEFLRIPKPCDPQDKAPFNLEKSSNNLAKFFSNHSPYASAKELSESLVDLVDTLPPANTTGKNRTYNYLISEVYDKLGPHSQTKVAASHFNSETQTWDNVFLHDDSYPRTPPVRIFQPGNSIRSIADDRMQYLRNSGKRVDSSEFIEDMMKLNGIKSTSDVQVGTPLKLPR